MTQSIGDKIIAAIATGPLVRIANADRNGYDDNAVFVWSQSAAEQLEAVVEAHIEERVRVRLELDRQALQERAAKLEKALMIASEELWREFGGSEANGPQLYFDELLVKACRSNRDESTD